MSVVPTSLWSTANKKFTFEDMMTLMETNQKKNLKQPLLIIQYLNLNPPTYLYSPNHETQHCEFSIKKKKHYENLNLLPQRHF